MIDNPDAPPIEKAFQSASSILTNEGWDLCYVLQSRRTTLSDARNSARRLRPDRLTAELWSNRIGAQYSDTFAALLDVNLLLMPKSTEIYGEREHPRMLVQVAHLARLRKTFTLEEARKEQAARQSTARGGRRGV